MLDASLHPPTLLDIALAGRVETCRGPDGDRAVVLQVGHQLSIVDLAFQVIHGNTLPIIREGFLLSMMASLFKSSHLRYWISSIFASSTYQWPD